jgi:hypothetical protein
MMSPLKHVPTRGFIMSDDVELGRQVVRDGLLLPLRTRLGLSSSAMAVLLYASPITYRSWESRPDTRVWENTAAKLGRFYRAAMAQLEAADEEGITLEDKIPFHLAATLLGVPQELLLRRYREGEVPATDLGLLGLWVDKRDMRKVSA